MTLEYCCCCVILRNGCFIVSICGFILTVVECMLLAYIANVEQLLNTSAKIRFYMELISTCFIFMTSVILWIGTFLDETRWFEVWFYFAAASVCSLVASALYQLIFEFWCWFPVWNSLLSGLIAYCSFVVYSYYSVVLSKVVVRDRRYL